MFNTLIHNGRARPFSNCMVSESGWVRLFTRWVKSKGLD